MECKVSEMVKRGHDQAAELKASCGAVDVRDVAQLINDLATQLDVQLARSNTLAAENAGLKTATLDEIEVINRGGQAYCVKDGMAVNPIYARGWNDYRSKALSVETPETDSFLAEARASAITEYANKRGFSFQHGSIHAHFGNGDVMVGSVTFENGDAGINFAPVREKIGGVGTDYEWTKGKTAEQVDSVFVIASGNSEGLEVIRDKLSDAIPQLRQGGAE